MPLTLLLRFLPAFALSCLLCACPAEAQTLDPAVDFSLTSNPNGVWSYGYVSPSGGPLVLYPNSGLRSTLEYWRNDSIGDVPWVAHNSTPDPVSLGTALIAPGALTLHPGPGNQLSVIRFTAPDAGVYRLSGTFFGQDISSTTTDVHISLNGVPVFNGIVNGYYTGSEIPFDLTLPVLAGSTVDFSVGIGAGVGSSNYLYDSTGLTAAFTVVPEPSTVGLLSVSAIVLLCGSRAVRRSRGSVS